MWYQGEALKIDGSNYDGDMIKMFAQTCQTTFTDANSFFKCAESLTYNKSEIILGTKQFDTLTLTTSDMTADWDLMSYSMNHGRCYTPSSLGQLNETRQITVPLNKSVSYRIWIHDPEFFVISWNPSSVPFVEISLTTKQDTDLAVLASQFIGIEHYHRMNRDEYPCTEYRIAYVFFTLENHSILKQDREIFIYKMCSEQHWRKDWLQGLLKMINRWMKKSLLYIPVLVGSQKRRWQR